MVSISSETSEQTARKLRQVIAEADLHVLTGAWSFVETSRDAPPVLDDETLAVVRDADTWSVLRPSDETDAITPRFGVFSFHFPDAADNSGFVGWLATLLKQQTGTGVFVVCGSNTALGGIYDYWGCPIEVFDEVVEVVRTLTGAGATVQLADDVAGGDSTP